MSISSRPSGRAGWHAWLLLLTLVLCLPDEARAAERAEGFMAYLAATPAPRMVAYAPRYYRPDSPTTLPSHAEAELRGDLQRLRQAFDGIVTYSYSPKVSEWLVATAVEHGYRALLLGIWDPRSAMERDGTIRLVQTYGDRIAIAVAVGNEGRTMGRYKDADLAAAAQQLRAATAPRHLPLTSSEPAPSYGFDDPLLSFGDFLAPNIHLFEQPIETLDDAIAKINLFARRLARLARKPVLIKETGIPSEGGSGLRFTPALQAEFWRLYLAEGRRRTIDGQAVCTCVAFEAFDLEWKAKHLSNPLEGAWGLLDARGNAKPAWQVWQQQR